MRSASWIFCREADMDRAGGSTSPRSKSTENRSNASQSPAKESGMKRVFVVVLLTAAAAGLTLRAQDRTRKYVPVTDAMLRKPDSADWLMWRRTLDGWGYS